MASTFLDVTLKRGETREAASWRFASWADIGFLQGWADLLSQDSSIQMRDSSDFARQAAARWRDYSDKKLAAKSLEELQQRASTSSKSEFVCLLILQANWWFEAKEPLAFAYVRRTWSGGAYLEFVAGHPLAEGQVKGFIHATLRGLLRVAQCSGAQWVWWEATDGSFDKYEKLIGANNELFTSQPRIQDVFLVSVAKLQTLLNEAEVVASKP